MIINALFPTPVAQFHLDGGVTGQEIELVKLLGCSNSIHLNEGNYSTKSTYIRNNFPRINEFFYESIKEYWNSVIAAPVGCNFYITQSWINYTKPGEYHHAHTHANSIISGVFYFNALEKEDKIYFMKHGYNQIKIYAEEYNVFNADKWWLPVKTGDLLLFPSSLPHMVEPVTSDETRISLAFNVFVKGFLGSKENLDELILNP